VSNYLEDIKERFLEFIELNHLFKARDKILLAVSGGRDSMLMTDLFLSTAKPFSIAHANFHLRGEDSDRDQQFVKNYALNHSIPFHTIDFDTREVAQEDHISIEMAARNLRYEWFKWLLQENEYHYVATAHHIDDVVETFHLNLLRATGIKGLTSIPVTNGKIIRPILFLNREEINKYIDLKKIEFKEDYTNQESDVLRNKFRNKILPEIKAIQANYFSQVTKTISYLKQANNFIQSSIKIIINEIKSENRLFIQLDFSNYLQDENLDFILYEILKDYNFKSSQIEALKKALFQTEAAYFSFSSFRFSVENSRVYIQNTSIKKLVNVEIANTSEVLKIPEPYQQVIHLNEVDYLEFKLLKKSELAQLDFEKVKFPLKLRNWQNGDVIIPLGMRGKKKVSDILTDLKLNLFEKETSLVLCDKSGDIIWLVGLRINENYKVTVKTKEVLIIEIKKLKPSN